MHRTSRQHDDRGLAQLVGLPTVRAEVPVDLFESAVGATAADSADHRSRLGEADRRLLRAVVDQPGLPSSAYAKPAHISTRRAKEARGRLVEMGLLREHRVNTKGRGRSAIVLEPTEQGHEAMNHHDGGPKR